MPTTSSPTPHGHAGHDHAGRDAAPVRVAAVTRARWLTGLTIGWNAIEGVVAILAGLAAGSVALVGFGVDAAIELSSASVVAWRLHRERDGGCQQANDRTAVRLIAGSLALLATWVGVHAALDLVGQARPDPSIPGIVIAALSLVVMPVLARQKRRVAPALGSRAIEADASQTDICTFLSAALLVGLGANALFGWWWADPLAGLVIAGVAAVEARRTWTADALEDTCCA